MPRYYATIPFAGHVTVEVDATSKSEAIQKAFESDDLKIDNADEVEFFDELCSGNVLHASVNKAYAELART